VSELEYQDDKQYLNVKVCNELWEQIGLHTCFSNSLQNNQKLSTEHVARILTINRLIDPTSKSGTVKWLNETLLPEIMNISSSHYNKDKIFHELSAIHQSKDNIEKLFINFSRQLSKQDEQNGDFEVYYFDGTTSWFEGSDCEYSELALEKTRGFYSDVIGFVLVSDKSGYPVAWEVIHGNIKDQTAFEQVAKRMQKSYGVEHVTYCFDRGVACTHNFESIHALTSKFISGLNDNKIKSVFDINTFSTSTRIRLLDYCKLEIDQRKGILPINGFYTAGQHRFYNDLGVINDYRYVVSFSKEIYEREDEQRKEAIEKTLNQVFEWNIELKLAKKDRLYEQTEKELLDILKKCHTTIYFGYIIKTTVSQYKAQTHQIVLELNNNAVKEKNQTDGLLVYITDHTETIANKSTFQMSAYDICQHYRDKYVIEGVFQHMKSILDLRPMFVTLKDHVAAHFDIVVMAYFMNNYMYRKLAVSRRSFGHYIKEFYKDYYKDVKEVLRYLDEKKLKPEKIFDKNKIKRLMSKVNEQTPLSAGFVSHVNAYTEGVSLNEMFECINKHSNLIKLKAPNGLDIYKQKAGTDELKNILNLLKMDHLFPTGSKTSLRFS